MKNILLIIFVFFAAMSSSSAQRMVKGFVTDTKGESLIGVNIVVKGSFVGTSTDIDGNFELSVPDDAKTLVLSYTGYTTQEVDVFGLSTVNVTMAEGQVLDEVVVTALGISRSEKAIGYAVQTVNSDEIRNANTTNAINSLAGAAAGVQVTSSNGAAGAPTRVVIRGQTSFNGDNQALLVVDGIRLNNSENNTERSLAGVANSNRAIDLNPDDIENVTILKGAAATALYGIEGARGVILITTKRGNNKGLQVNVSSNITFSEVSNITGLQDMYAQGSGGNWQGPETGQSGSWGPKLSDVRYYNDPNNPYKWDKNGRIVSKDDPNAGAAVIPYDNVGNLFQTGTTLANNISFSGGNETSDYRFSFGNSDEKGITPGNTFKRYNAGLNLGTTVFDDKLDLRFSANYVKSGGRRVQQGSNTSGIMLGLLRTPVTFDNGNGNADPHNSVSSYQFEDGTQRNYRGGGGYDNPYWVTNLAPFNDNVNRFFGNITAAYKFHDWFTVNTVLGTDTYSDNRIQRFEIGSRTVAGGQVREDNYNYSHTDYYFGFRGQGNVTEDFSLSYNVGMNLYDEKLKNNYTQGDGLNFVGFAELSNASSISGYVVNTNQKTAGIFGTLDFGYKNFLYLTLTGRNDWSSTLIDPAKPFNAGDISFFYPSVSMGFVFSEFLDNTTGFLSYGKLRASYAEVGGGAPSSYSTSTPWILPVQNSGTINDVNDGWTSGLGFPFKGQSGFVLNAVAGNPNLTPSKTKDKEIGLDLRFLNNRIGLDMTYYTRQSIDQIIAINIPNSTGFQRAFVNSGELSTKGGEVVLNISPIRNKDFSWNVGLNWSKWKTIVESLPEGVQNQYLDGFNPGTYNIAPEKDGTKYEYGQLFGNPFQRVNGVDANGNPSFDASKPFNKNGALIIDSNPNSSTYGFPLPDPVSRVVGNPNPDWLLGITNTVNYKDFSLSFLFDIREGGDIWNGTKGALTFFGMSELTENRGTVVVFDGILADSDGAVNNIAVELDQAWYQGDGGGFATAGEHFVEDASFYRLRYATLSYDLGNVLSSIGFDALNLSITGRNLFLSTPYTGFDPELSLVGGASNGQGSDYFQLPSTRSISVGLSARF